MEYEKESDLFVPDWRFQLLLDFYDSPKLRRYFLRLGVFQALCTKKMKREPTLQETIKKKLVKPECLTAVSF